MKKSLVLISSAAILAIAGCNSKAGEGKGTLDNLKKNWNQKRRSNLILSPK